MSDSLLAWHFSDGTLHHDYEGVKIESGLLLETTDKPVFEQSSFYACLRPLDAFYWYAVRPQTKFIVSRVCLSGEMLNKDIYGNKHPRIVAQKREHLWVADAESTLQTLLNYYLNLYENINPTKKDLAKDTIAWIAPDLEEKDIVKILDIKDYERIKARVMQFQIVDFFHEFARVQQICCFLKIWQAARQENFDIEPYLKNYGFGMTWQDLGEIGIPELVYEFFGMPREYAISLPPEDYLETLCDDMLSEPNELLHTMLMQLAPDGYSE